MQTQPQTTTLYDSDFYAWTQQQAEYLRSGKLESLDVGNLAEEIESLGKKQKRELETRLRVLLEYLLKWHYYSEQRSTSWFYTIHKQRREILEHLLKENPSFKPFLFELIEDAYQDAVERFGIEINPYHRNLPKFCPFSNEIIFIDSIDFPEPHS